jgi:hypothetical protein
VRGIPNDGSGLTLTDEETFLDFLKDRFAAWYGSHSMCRSDAKLDWLKCNRIAPDGTYAEAGVTHERLYTPGILGPNGEGVPTILTCCWSWRTARSRGPGSHGRIYPPVSLGPGPSMIIPTADVTDLLTAAKDFLGVLAAPNFPEVGNGFAVCVVSDQDVIEPVTRVTVGNVIDVQRRRKNQLAETYQSFAGPPWSAVVEG